MQTINQRVTEATAKESSSIQQRQHDTTQRKTEKERETAVTVEKIYEKSDRGTLSEQGNSGQGKKEGIDCG